jgi:hypothetical protein
MTKTFAVGWATVVFGVWMLATYLLEGRIRTLLRPDATATRFAYTMIANVLIGTVAAALVIRVLMGGATVADPGTYGIAGPRRTLLMIILGVVLAGASLVAQRLPSWHPMVLANAFAQVLVVSIAEVLVCWAVLGGTVHNVLGPGILSATLAILVAALAFGLYHFAHSPPFNAARMVLALSGVGVATGLVFFIGGDLYGTIIFHNALALRGVTEALGKAGRLEFYRRPQPALIATAIAATVVLATADLVLIRPLAGAVGS